VFWAKDTLFRVPVFGRWLRWLGGVPVDRRTPAGAVAEMVQRMENLPPDAYQSFQYQMAMDHTKLYYSGGTPVINLFNPIAWAQFVQAWQSGAFKAKD